MFQQVAILAMVTALSMGVGACASSSGPVRHEIQVGTEGYQPAHVRAKPGQEVVLVFTRTTDQTCGTEVVIPSENRTVPLPLNQPTEVHLVAKEIGEIHFHCGMKMLQGSVEVN